MSKAARVRTIPDVVRHNPISWFIGALLSIYISVIERPHVVITTGVGVVAFFYIYTKLLGAKLIFLESMAWIEEPTLTTRLLYPFSDLFIVQWPNLLRFFPRAQFEGRLF